MAQRFLLFLGGLFLVLQTSFAQNRISKPNITTEYGLEVNSFTGNLFLKLPLLEIPSQYLGIDAYCSYNSNQKSQNLGYGFGWTFSYNIRYYNKGKDTVGIRKADGETDFYVLNRLGKYESNAENDFGTLEELPAGSKKFVWTTKEGVKYYFDNPTHKAITKISVPQANYAHSITLTYSGFFPTEIRDSFNRKIRLVWNTADTLLNYLIDENGGQKRVFSFKYQQKHLTEIQKPIGNVQFAYSNGLLSHQSILQKADKRLKVDILYDNNQAVYKVLTCYKQYEFIYDRVRSLTQSTISDLNDSKKKLETTYTFGAWNGNPNHRDRLVEKTGFCLSCGGSVSNKQEFVYDNQGNVVHEKKNGINYTNDYDNKGNLVSRYNKNKSEYTPVTYLEKYHAVLSRPQFVTNRLNNLKTEYKYTTTNLVEQITRKKGATTLSTQKFNYLSNGLLSNYTDARNNIFQYAYNSFGYLQSLKSPEGLLKNYNFDNGGNLLAYTNPKNHTISYAYNSMNWLQEQKEGSLTIQHAYDSVGNLLKTTYSDGYAISYEYDDMNRLIKKIEPLNRITQFSYDFADNLVSVIDPKGNKRTFHYNALNQLESEEAPLGVKTIYEYDPVSNKRKSLNRNGILMNMVYDNQNRLQKTTQRNEKNDQFAYDNNDNLISETDPEGNKTAYNYDPLDQLTQITYPDNSTVTYKLDPNGNRTEIKDQDGFVRKQTFDRDNRLIKIETPSRTLELIYDGEYLSSLKINGKTIKTYQYNQNLLVAEINALNERIEHTYLPNRLRQSTKLPNGNILSYQYDQARRLIGISDKIGKIVDYTYDPNSNLLSVKDGLGNTTTFIYDGLDRRIATTDPMGNRTQVEFTNTLALGKETQADGSSTTFENDPYNRIQAEINSLGHKISYEYGKNDQLKSIIDPKGNKTTYEYNTLGQRTKETFANQRSVQYQFHKSGLPKERTDQKGQKTTYAQDSEDNLTETTYPNGQKVIRKYDQENNLLSVINAHAEVSFEYDPIGRKTKETIRFISANFSKSVPSIYSTALNTRTLIYPSGRVISEKRDERNRLTEVKLNNQALATWTWNLANLPSSKKYGNNVSTTYQYDPNKRLTNLKISNVAEYNYTYDQNGNKLSQQDLHRPQSTETYAYENDRLRTFEKGGSRTDYELDENGNLKPFAVNELNQYTAWAYDENGNFFGENGDYRYTYENQLSQTAQAQYLYDGLGRRIAKILPSKTIYYVYDGDRIIEEYSPTAWQKSYVYGTWVDDLLFAQSATHTGLYYHHNHLGSTVALTNTAGQVLERYEYEAYGKPYFYDPQYQNLPASNYGNEYLFTGRQYDLETGLYYFRARHYHPVQGRFLQTDPLGYVDGMNLYGAYFVPNGIDPSGKYWVALHYSLAKKSAIRAGCSEEQADLLANYASNYADNPDSGLAFLNKIAALIIDGVGFGDIKTDTRERYPQTANGQSDDPKYTTWHCMKASSEGSMTEIGAIRRCVKFINEKSSSSNEEDVGQAIHAYQDLFAHQGMSMTDHVDFGESPISSTNQTFHKDANVDDRVLDHIIEKGAQIIRRSGFCKKPCEKSQNNGYNYPINAQEEINFLGLKENVINPNPNDPIEAQMGVDFLNRYFMSPLVIKK